MTRIPDRLPGIRPHRSLPIDRADWREQLAKLEPFMHPFGRCTCAGEGTCAWCKESERQQRLEAARSAFATTAEERTW